MEVELHQGSLARSPSCFHGDKQTFSLQSESGGEGAGLEEEPVELFTTPTTKLGAAVSDFGYNLFRALASREASTNVFLSPISVSAALSQLSLGKHPTLKPTHSPHFPTIPALKKPGRVKLMSLIFIYFKQPWNPVVLIHSSLGADVSL